MEHENVHTPTEYRILGAGKATKKLIAKAQDNEVLVFVVILQDVSETG